jgi:hypothetical protein
MRKPDLCRAVVALGGLVLLAASGAHGYEPIHVGFVWHMHQPIYYPYESIIDTDASSTFITSDSGRTRAGRTTPFWRAAAWRTWAPRSASPAR